MVSVSEEIPGKRMKNIVSKLGVNIDNVSFIYNPLAHSQLIRECLKVPQTQSLRTTVENKC